MSKELKDLIDSVDLANQAHSDLETTIRNLKEEVQKLNFTIGEQRTIIQNQKLKLSSTQNNNTSEDASVLKELVTQQRQDIIKKDKDIEILQQTISESFEELENFQKFEGENEEIIYANKEIVQLTEENENFRSKVEELNNTLTNLQKDLDKYKEAPDEESSDMLDIKKLDGINRVQIESSKQEIENLRKLNQENEALKNQFLHELIEVNKIIDQLTYDNDQYHEKVNHLKQRNSDMEKKLGAEINFGNQKISDLREKVFEKDEELNNVNLKLQKFENANKQLSDLIVDFKVRQDKQGENIEFESSSKRIVYEDLPPNLFFKMYRLLLEEDKTTIVNQLINDLNSEIRDFRTYAIKILSVIKGDRVFEVLKEIISDDDWIVKLYLIKAFRNFNKDDTIPLLKKLQEDNDIDVREAAIRVLSELKRTSMDVLPH